MDLSTVQPIVNTAVPLAVAGIFGWLVKEVVALCPAAASFLTAARVKAAEEALSNIIVAKSSDILSGKTTIADQAEWALKTLSSQAKAAMSAQGTTNDMLAARAVGNALVKIGTLQPAAAGTVNPNVEISHA